MNTTPLIRIVALLALLAIPAQLWADERPLIREQAEKCVKSTQQLKSIITQNKDKADSELISASDQLENHAIAFNVATQKSKHPKKASQEEFWKLIRHLRDFDAALSVSPLRKNADVKAAYSDVKSVTAKLKQHF